MKKIIFSLFFAIIGILSCLVFITFFNEDRYFNRVLISQAVIKSEAFNSAEATVQNLKSKNYQKKVLDNLNVRGYSFDSLKAISAMESAKVLRANYIELTLVDSESKESLLLLESIGELLAEEQNNRMKNNINSYKENIKSNTIDYVYTMNDYKRCISRNNSKGCNYIRDRLDHLNNAIVQSDFKLLSNLEPSKVLAIESTYVKKYSITILLTFSSIFGCLIGLIFYDFMVGKKSYIDFSKSTNEKV